MDNDVKMTFDTHVVKDNGLLKRDFSLNVDIDTNHRLTFCFRAVEAGVAKNEKQVYE